MIVVRVVGVEPTLLAKPDFEPGGSTNSTTLASSRLALSGHPGAFLPPKAFA